MKTITTILIVLCAFAITMAFTFLLGRYYQIDFQESRCIYKNPNPPQHNYASYIEIPEPQVKYLQGPIRGNET